MSAKKKALWQSADGQSRLFHTDCLKLMREMESDSIDCIWTDPPYFLSNDGTTCIAGKRSTVNKGKWDKSQGIQLDHEFNREWLAECQRILKPSGSIWVSGTLHVYLSVGMAMQQLGYRILNDIIWEKPNPPPNLGCRCFTHATEVILWATRAENGPGEKHTFNYEAMKQENEGKQMKNVWRFTAPRKDEKEHGKHPTQKPLELISRCLLASTRPGDLVFDPFSGSASTGVAALRLGRHFIGAEQDKEHASLAKRRLQAASQGNDELDRAGNA